ncbi:MAG: hypothetical protein N2035_07225 [Chthoniobacterales bacterium]|nr:hypothetical protein [Chthoniobacterales bacterium]
MDGSDFRKLDSTSSYIPSYGNLAHSPCLVFYNVEALLFTHEISSTTSYKSQSGTNLGHKSIAEEPSSFLQCLLLPCNPILNTIFSLESYAALNLNFRYYFEKNANIFSVPYHFEFGLAPPIQIPI